MVRRVAVTAAFPHVMKGIVFNVLEQVVREEYGEPAWDKLLDDTGLDGVYTSLSSYPDEDLSKLVAAASELLGKPANEIVHWFGYKALAIFAERYPQFFTPHKSARDLILALNRIIHPEVRKSFPGADVPDFDFDVSDPEGLGMTYRSKRRLCAFALGLIEGSVSHYGQEAVIEETSCMHHGADCCRIKIRFLPQPR